jgi:hypothetical protein
MPVFDFGNARPVAAKIANYSADSLEVGATLANKNGKRIATVIRKGDVYGTVWIDVPNFDSEGAATYEITLKQLERHYPNLIQVGA